MIGNYAMLRTVVAIIWRRRGVNLILAAVVALGVFGAVVLTQLANQQELAMQDMIKNTRINCIVTDASGKNSDSLDMHSSIVDRLMGHRHGIGCYLDESVKNVRALCKQKLSEPAGYELRRILSFDSDRMLSAVVGAKIQLDEGWDEDILQTQEPVCLIPGGMIPEYREDGTAWITLELDDSIRELQVIGTITGGPEKAIYASFYFRWNPEVSEMYIVDSCSFDIKDNAQLEKCKADIYQYFAKPSLSSALTATTPGVLIQDEIYLNSLEEIESTIEMLRLLVPLLIALCGCIGFFASYLSTRTRVKEFAVMRCLGLKQRRVFVLVFLEFLLLTAAGSGLGLLAGCVVEGGVSLPGLGYGGLLVGVFLLGSAVATWRVTRVNVMKLMKVED